MGGIKVYVSDKTEQDFRKTSMAVFGYQKGSLSIAAQQAFEHWNNSIKKTKKAPNIPKDPVGAIKSIVIRTKESSVELQHTASKLRAQKPAQKTK